MRKSCGGYGDMFQSGTQKVAQKRGSEQRESSGDIHT